MAVRAHRLVLLGVCAAALLAAAPAYAEDDPRELARQHFERALALVDKREHAAAAEEFRQAYQASPHFSVLYNLGQALADSGREAEAHDALLRYLGDGGAEIDAERRTEVEAQLVALASKTATLELAVEPGSAALSLDGKSIAAGPVRVQPGRHELAATAPGHRPKTEAIDLVAGESRRLDLRLEPEAAPPLPIAPPAPPPPPIALPVRPPEPPAESLPPQRIASFAVGGTGLALGVAAIALAGYNEGRFGDWQDEREALQLAAAQTPPPADVARRARDNDELLGSIEDVDRLAAGLGIGGAALAATGVVLFFTAGDGSGRAVAVLPSRGGASAHWTAPW